jgi:ribosomal protein L19
MLKIFFLKKKRLLKHQHFDFFLKIKPGTILFFEYVSLDRDLFSKYRLYGLCVGLKKKSLMSTCYINSIIFGNQIKYVFYIYSPLIFNLKVFGNIYINKYKFYHITPKLRVFKQITN